MTKQQSATTTEPQWFITVAALGEFENALLARVRDLESHQAGESDIKPLRDLAAKVRALKDEAAREAMAGRTLDIRVMTHLGNWVTILSPYDDLPAGPAGYAPMGEAGSESQEAAASAGQ